MNSVCGAHMKEKAAVVDSRYYEAAPPGSFAERVMIKARERIYQDFLRVCAPKPGERILDVGVSDVITDGANLLERHHPRAGDITATGLGSGEQFQAAFPGIRYDRIQTGTCLPYADRSFEIAVSNAVLEHVGGIEQQRAFIAEMTRVADRVFITVPHRYFPVEHHTAIPFAHWFDKTFSIVARALGHGTWLKEENLVLMARSNLKQAAGRKQGWFAEVGLTGLPLGPFSSNLYLFMEPIALARPRLR